MPGKKNSSDFALSCPLPMRDYPVVTMAHGAGGALTKRLVDEMFAPVFANPELSKMHDGAVFNAPDGRLAFTTDSYVVNPLFFPGGDIGSLAVYGTINDLAMCGARPLHLSLGLIIEEGLPMETLWRVVQSIAAACDRVGVKIVTGDTKVVDRGKGDGIFINSAGVGAVITPLDINADAVQPGDAVILSGDIGRHGVAVLSAREHLEFECDITSDCAPLHKPVLALLNAGIGIHCLRDLTRGGLATALNEIASQSRCDIEIDEEAISIHEGVKGATEILGLDPLYIANEGRFVIILPEGEAANALTILRQFDETKENAVIGVVKVGSGELSCKTLLGQRRPLDLLTGDQLPRIC